jgi:hypothetical protein
VAEWMEEQLLSLLERFRACLPATDYVHVRDMLLHREWGVGLEDLCTQLYQHGVKIEPAELETIKALTARMQLSAATWRMLDRTSGGMREW